MENDTSKEDSGTRRPAVAIITPVYNESENLDEYERAVRKALFSLTDFEFTVTLVDDGSTDDSWEKIRGLAESDGRFRGVRLSRNFGSHIAISAGFDAAEGDAYAVLCCDLQDPPEVVAGFLDRWKRGAKIVWGARRLDRESGAGGLVNRLFYRLMNRSAVPRGTKFTTGSFFLVDRAVADCIRMFPEQHRITFALVALTGFEQDVVEYSRNARHAGRSGWTAGRKLKALYDAFFGYSFLPIRMITILGAGVFFVAVILAIYTLYCKYTSNPVEGYTSLVLSFCFFFGIQFFLMGIVGEYLYRIYTEVMRRPLYFISDRTGGPGDEA